MSDIDGTSSKPEVMPLFMALVLLVIYLILIYLFISHLGSNLRNSSQVEVTLTR